MTKTVAFKRIICVFMVLCMLFAYAPDVCFAYVMEDSYNYTMTVQIADEKYAGTDSDIYLKVYFNSGKSTFSEKMDTKNHNDFERNSKKSYTFKINAQPWEISHVEIYNSGKDEMKVKEFWFSLPDGRSIYRWVNTKFQEKGVKYDVSSETKRIVKDPVGFIKNFGGIKYYYKDEKNAQDITMNWNCEIQDNYTDYILYKPFDYPCAPSVEYSAYGKSSSNRTIKIEDIMDSCFVDYSDAGYTLKTQDLLNKMEELGVFKIDIKSDLKFNSSADEKKTFSKTLTIIRREFELGKAKILTSPYTPSRDKNFFNSDVDNIKIEIPVLDRDNYDAQTIAKSLVEKVSNDDLKLYYGKGENEYVTSSSKTASGKKIVMEFPMPEGYSNNEETGMKLEMTNLKAKCYGTTYDCDNYTDTFDSKYKIDTHGTVFTLRNEAGENISGFDKYAKMHTFKLDSTKTPYIKNKESFFSYKLYKTSAKLDEIKLSSKYTTGTAMSPYTSDTVYKIDPVDDIEGDFYLDINASDFSGNKTNFGVDKVRIDKVAPRATYKKKEVSAGNTKRLEYTFKIDDITGNSKLYYCFVDDGNSIPAINEASAPEFTTGTIDTIRNQWAFIRQENAEKQTIVLYLDDGEVFNGNLYYYTVDEAGNNSRNETATGKINGFYYVNSNLSNENLECEIVVNDVTPGLPEYDISFNTPAANTVKYRWKSSNNVTVEKTYSGENVGSKTQKKSDGSELILDGAYTLECTVSNPTTGNSETYKRDFVFDNTKPEITAILKSGKVSDMQSVSLYAEDISSIETLEYKLVNPDGSDVEGAETIQIPAKLPKISTDFTVAPAKTGAYKICIRAVDSNGFETLHYTDTFSIRNSAPKFRLSCIYNGHYYESDTGMIINTQDEYKFNLFVVEEAENIDNFKENQIVKYRVSDDGVNYSDWIIADEIKKSEDLIGEYSNVFRLIKDIDPVLPLVEGENSIFIEVVCVSVDDNMKDIPVEYIARDSIDIYYDPTPPQYKLDFDDLELTSESVFGTITVKDNCTTPDEMVVFVDSNYTDKIILGETPEIFGDEAIFSVEIKENVETNIYVSDGYNRVEVPIKIDCIDIDPPKVTSESSYSNYYGDRLDATVTFSIDEGIEEKTKFAVMECDPPADPSETGGTEIELEPLEIDDSLFETENSALKVKIVNQEMYENGESNTFYNIEIRGEETSKGEEPTWYTLVAYLEDALGNSTKRAIGRSFKIKDVDAELSDYYVRGSTVGEPTQVGKKAIVDLRFNVPVYLLPQSEIPDRGNYANDAEYLEAVNELTLVNAGYYQQDQSMLVDDYGDYTIYFADECGRVYQENVTVNESMVTFNADFEASAKLYEVADDGNITLEAITSSNEISKISIFEDGMRYFVVIEPNDTYSQMFSKYDEWSDKFSFDEELSVAADGDWYTTAVFEVYNYYSEYYNNDIKDIIIPYNMKTTVADTSEIVESVEGYGIHIEDLTPPVISIEQFQRTLTDPVDVMFTFYDPETAQILDADMDDGSEEAGESYTSAELAAMAGIAKVEATRVYVDGEDYSDPVYNDLGALDSYQVRFETNGYMAIRVTNTLGLTSTKEIWVDSIVDEPITESDYWINYYYEDSNGELQWFDIETETTYFKSVIAELEPTGHGSRRGLYVSNNLKSFEKELTEFEDSFTFNLRDKYGFTHSCEVSYDKFDSSGPKITYAAGSNVKTNQPVDITVTVSDISEIDSVTLTPRNGEAIVLTKLEDVADAQIPTSKYTGKISASGLYTIKAIDKIGNSSIKNFIVSNIDTTKPEVYKMAYTSTEMTNQNVGVKLYYTKSGVKLQSVEPAGGTALTAGDITVDYSNSMIRFLENGTVNVKFVDEYGNVGNDVVTVDNINRTAPTLKAVSELSDDLLSVKVKFEQEVDENGVPKDIVRGLADINILYYGISETADKAEFELIENGVYTFRAFDNIGNTQVIKVTVDGIDKAAPVITQVSWGYDYYDESGELKKAAGNWTPGNEAGYMVVADENHKPTNQDVTVNIETDKETVFVGSGSKDYSKAHSMLYDENGMYIFNLERQNKMMAQYGVGIYLIDKIPPVIEDVEDLIFYENSNAGSVYDKSMLTDFTAYDMKGTIQTNVKDSVVIDYGDFNPDNFAANKFDRTKPYEITYTVKDKVGNETQVKRKVTLVGMFDTVMLVNGQFPDSSNRIEVESDTVELTLNNFSGKAYARYEKGYYTSGEMKYKGTVIQQNGGKFVVSGLKEGWYTFYVQTDLRDYFCVNVYVINNK